MNLAGLGYVGLNASDPAAWVEFGAGILGMVPVAADGDENEVRLRMDDRPWRIAVHRADRPGFAYIGWELRNERGFDEAVQTIEAHGYPCKLAGDDEAAARCVRGLARFAAPGGHDTELFFGPGYAPRFVSPLGVSFVTEGVGMGHVVPIVAAAELDEALRFYTDVMGFGVSEHIRSGPARGALLHCTRRHHSLGLIGVGDRPGVHHLMVEVTDPDDVGRCWDRCEDQEVPIMLTLGRHSDDYMFSFYMVSPSGIGVEYGSGGRLIDPATWSTLEMDGDRHGDFWGHRRPEGRR